VNPAGHESQKRVSVILSKGHSARRRRDGFALYRQDATMGAFIDSSKPLHHAEVVIVIPSLSEGSLLPNQSASSGRSRSNTLLR